MEEFFLLFKVVVVVVSIGLILIYSDILSMMQQNQDI